MSRAKEAVWKGNLSHILPPPPKLQRGHMRALAYQEIPEFMKRLAAKDGMAARAMEFTILTIAHGYVRLGRALAFTETS